MVILLLGKLKCIAEGLNPLLMTKKRKIMGIVELGEEKWIFSQEKDIEMIKQKVIGEMIVETEIEIVKEAKIDHKEGAIKEDLNKEKAFKGENIAKENLKSIMNEGKESKENKIIHNIGENIDFVSK